MQAAVAAFEPEKQVNCFTCDGALEPFKQVKDFTCGGESGFGDVPQTGQTNPEADAYIIIR